MDLFDAAGQQRGVPQATQRSPLAVRMRPQSLSELAGQAHLLEPGSPLRRLVEPGEGTRSSVPSSIILWGPPGTGKTTLAYLIAQTSGRRFVELSAVTAGVKELREVISEAKRRLTTAQSDADETILFIDEVHRFNRTQQDALLPAVENRWVTLVAATTENPSFSVNTPLLSRSLMLTLQPLSGEDVTQVIERALASERGFGGKMSIDPQALHHIVRLAGPDARKALTVLEAAAGTVLDAGQKMIELAAVEQVVDIAAVQYDQSGDQHYDVTSAFIKSMRGSDVDAALHYLARMIVAGEDPRFIARRVVIAAAEEVGMADPSALQTAVAAAQSVALIGLPEARIILAQAVVHVATAPKSNRAYKAIDAAIADVRSGDIQPVPQHLRDAHYAGAAKLGHGTEYIYAHDSPNGVAAQEYLPPGLQGRRYYEPTDRGFEVNLQQRLERIRAILPNMPDHS